MNTITTDPPSEVAEQTGLAAAAKKPRQRRMAREPRVETAVESLDGNLKKMEPKVDQSPRPTSKINSVLALLERPQGATLAELVEATDWQPHTTRAALTGLKKKGHVITKDKRGDVTCYRIAMANG